MEKVTVLTSDQLYNSFLDPKYIPAGQNKYYLRNTQVCAPKNGWRHLTSYEIEALVKNDNTAMSWDNILVTDEFDPMMIKNNKFYGFVRIGRVTSNGLQYHDLRLSIGITNSSIHSCDIGDDCAIHNVHYLSHNIIGDRCMLFNIQEMSCTDHAKFGNGIVKEGEPEDVRVWLELMNETGCRKVLPFDGMIAADAYMWAKFIDDKRLQDRLKAITQSSFDSRRGFYGTIGYGNVIKNCWIIKDVKIGADFLDQVLFFLGAAGVQDRAVDAALKEPFPGERTVLDVGQDVGHSVLGVFRDDHGASGEVAVFGGITDGVAHAGEAFLVDEVNNELHLVAAFEVGDLGLIARFHQGLEAGLDKGGAAAAQNGLFAEEVGLGLFFEGGLKDAGTGSADAFGVGQGDLFGFAGGVLIDSDEVRDAAAFHEDVADEVSGALGGDHDDVNVRGRNDLAEMNVEAVGESQSFAGGQVRLDVLVVDVGLAFIRSQVHDDVSLLGHFRDGNGLEVVLLGQFVVFGAGALGDDDFNAAVPHVLGVSVALGTVADDTDGLAVKKAKISILVVIHNCHKFLLYKLG